MVSWDGLRQAWLAGRARSPRRQDPPSGRWAGVRRCGPRPPGFPGAPRTLPQRSPGEWSAPGPRVLRGLPPLRVSTQSPHGPRPGPSTGRCAAPETTGTSFCLTLPGAQRSLVKPEGKLTSTSSPLPRACGRVPHTCPDTEQNPVQGLPKEAHTWMPPSPGQ